LDVDICLCYHTLSRCYKDRESVFSPIVRASLLKRLPLALFFYGSNVVLEKAAHDLSYVHKPTRKGS
jgi:hypothetical protein